MANSKAAHARRAANPLPPRGAEPIPTPWPEAIPDRERRFLDKVALGHTWEDACRLSGFPSSTFERWLQRGDASLAAADAAEADERPLPPPDEPYHSFSRRVREAESLAVDAALLAVKEHFARDPNAALKFLAKKRPDTWGDPKEKAPAPTGAQVVIVMPSNGRDAPAIGSSTPEVLDVEARED